MTVKVTCPNPACKNHETPFKVSVPSPIAKKGGSARWSLMSAKQRKEHIARMTKARLRKKK